MPEALARADFDFTGQERPLRPRSAQTPRRRASRDATPGLPAQMASHFLGVLRQNPGRSVVAAGLCCFAAAFITNALWLQRGHRHALDLPLYHRAAPVQPRARVPLPPQMPAAMAQKSAAMSKAQALNTLPMLAPLPPQMVQSSSLSQGDGIARLLGHTNADANPTAPSFSARALAVQRALVRLGYKVTADGVYGRTTRSAIARFEHSAKLPETGNMGERMRAALAKRSGETIP